MKPVIHVIAIQMTLVSNFVFFSLLYKTLICLDQVCDGLIEFLADGFCDDENNNEHCDDGGDCCLPEPITEYCTKCECLQKNKDDSISSDCLFPSYIG